MIANSHMKHSICFYFLPPSPGSLAEWWKPNIHHYEQVFIHPSCPSLALFHLTNNAEWCLGMRIYMLHPVKMFILVVSAFGKHKLGTGADHFIDLNGSSEVKILCWCTMIIWAYRRWSQDMRQKICLKQCGQCALHFSIIAKILPPTLNKCC